MAWGFHPFVLLIYTPHNYPCKKVIGKLSSVYLYWKISLFTSIHGINLAINGKGFYKMTLPNSHLLCGEGRGEGKGYRTLRSRAKKHNVLAENDLFHVCPQDCHGRVQNFNPPPQIKISSLLKKREVGTNIRGDVFPRHNWLKRK